MNKLVIIAIIIIVIVLTGFIMIQSSPRFQAKDVVNDFYSYEQEGRFASSWELFHSLMKEKFSKGHYLQDRAHVFMNHFGVITFDYSLSDVDKLRNWKMSEQSESLPTVYRVSVTQTYQGKYGNFDINQDVFAAKEDGEWRVLWNYNK